MTISLLFATSTIEEKYTINIDYKGTLFGVNESNRLVTVLLII